MNERVGRERRACRKVGRDEREAEERQERVRELLERRRRVHDEEHVAEVVEQDHAEGIDVVVDAWIVGPRGERLGRGGEALGRGPALERVRGRGRERSEGRRCRGEWRVGVERVFPAVRDRLADARRARVPERLERGERAREPAPGRLGGAGEGELGGAEEVELDDGLEGGESAFGESWCLASQSRVSVGGDKGTHQLDEA